VNEVRSIEAEAERLDKEVERIQHLHLIGDSAGMLAAIPEVAQLARECRNTVNEIIVEYYAASALLDIGRTNEAIERIAAGLELSEQIRQMPWQARLLGLRAHARFARDEYDAGLQDLARATHLMELETTPTCELVAATTTVANACFQAGLYELAERHHLRNETLLVTCGTPRLRLIHRNNLAHLYVAWALRYDHYDRPDEARALYQKAADIADQVLAMDEPSVMASWKRGCVAIRALCLTKFGKNLEAMALAGPLLEDPARPLDRREEVVANTAYGIALAGAGNGDEAAEVLATAAKLAERNGANRWRCEALRRLAVVYEDQNDLRRSVATWKEVLRLSEAAQWRMRTRRVESMQVRMRVEQLSEQNSRYQVESLQDPLTGLPNRRHLQRRLAELVELASSQGRRLVMGVVDIDRFKHINDTFTHLVGDSVLSTVATLLRRHLHQQDFAARYAGDEFVFALVDVTGYEAELVAERIRRSIEAHDWRAMRPGLEVTVSIGLATWEPPMTAASLFSNADAQLFAAKRAGRNSVRRGR
jgi:diguanylate cyclase